MPRYIIMVFLYIWEVPKAKHYIAHTCTPGWNL